MNNPTDLNGKKFQLTFLRPAQMIMFSIVSCNPALGQSTVVSTDSVRFTVLIESSVSFSNQPWEAVIWHNGNSDGQWAGLDLTRVKPADKPVSEHIATTIFC